MPDVLSLLLSVLFLNPIHATHATPTDDQFRQLQKRFDQVEKRHNMEIAELRQVSMKYMHIGCVKMDLLASISF